MRPPVVDLCWADAGDDPELPIPATPAELAAWWNEDGTLIDTDGDDALFDGTVWTDDGDDDDLPYD